MEKAPAGITGSFSMLFLMVFGRYPEKFSLGIFFSLQPVYRSNTIRLCHKYDIFGMSPAQIFVLDKSLFMTGCSFWKINCLHLTNI